MTTAMWRTSHLLLAIVASVFVLVASITGAALALEPVQYRMSDARLSETQNTPVATTVAQTMGKYLEVLSIKKDKHGRLLVEIIPEDDGPSAFYIHPLTGEKLGDIKKQTSFFKFMTGLHRSLFLQRTGRAIMGIVAFLMCLILISGVMLIVKRQQGIKGFFSKIIKENTEQYWHIQLGRWVLLPVLVLSLSGTYLFLERFKIIPTYKENLEATASSTKGNTVPPKDFAIFKNTTWADCNAIQFPFMGDPEEYFEMQTTREAFLVQQETGQIVGEYTYPITSVLSVVSDDWHTGSSHPLWAIVLGLSSLSLPYFVYSGFVLYWRRSKTKFKNQYTAKEAHIVLLVGSENGSTKAFAKALYNQCIAEGKKAFIANANDYALFPKMNTLLVLTATYGQGEAPSSAKKFLTRFEGQSPTQNFTYGVIGFGSHAYPEFCAFAYEVAQCLSALKNATAIAPVQTVNNKSFEAFTAALKTWAKALDMQLRVQKPAINGSTRKTTNLEVLYKTQAAASPDDTFLIGIEKLPNKNTKPGDLLAVFAKGEAQERLYSIGMDFENNLLLSIRRHQFGVCSNYLNDLKVSDTFEAYFNKNKAFHFPKKATIVTAIATGTGIAPFLGMIAQNHKKTPLHLYWGGRNEASLDLYKPIVNRGLRQGYLEAFCPAYSRANTPKTYVQDLIKTHSMQIIDSLDKGGYIMLCGSIAMQNTVMEVLYTGCKQYGKRPLHYYQQNNRILVDCY